MKELIIEKLYEWSKKPYQKFMKTNKAWDISIPDLIRHDEQTLGFQLGCFLLKYNFQIQPQLEDHDIIHVLTNTGITVPEEIGMQYYLFGNGKRSLYLSMVIAIGTLFYPTHFKNFMSFYKRGKRAHRFHDVNFLNMLKQPVTAIQYSFNIS